MGQSASFEGGSLYDFLPYDPSFSLKSVFLGNKAPATAYTSPPESPLIGVSPWHNPLWMHAIPDSKSNEAIEEMHPRIPQMGVTDWYHPILGRNYPPFLHERKQLLDSGFMHPHSDPRESQDPSYEEWHKSRQHNWDSTGFRPGLRARRYLQDDLWEACHRDADRSWNQCVQQSWANALLGFTEVRPPRGVKPEDRVFTTVQWLRAVEPLHRGMPYERDQNGRRRFHWMRRDAKTNVPVGGWDRPDKRFAVPVAHDFGVMPLGPDITWDQKIAQGTYGVCPAPLPPGNLSEKDAARAASGQPIHR